MKYFLSGFLLTLTGTLVFVLAVYTTDLRRHVDITTIHLADAKKHMLRECHDIYIIGDSSGNGIDADYISKRLKRDVVNLVISVNMGWQGYKNIARTIHKTCKPERMIMYMTPRGVFYDAGKKGTFDGFYTNLVFGGFLEMSKYLVQNFRVLPQTALITLRKARPDPFPYQLPEYYNQSQRDDIAEGLDNKCEISYDLSDGKELEKFPSFKESMRGAFPDTKITFVSAPLPKCTTNKDDIDAVNMYIDKDVEYMDNRYFRDYTHLSKAGIKPASKRLINAIKD